MSIIDLLPSTPENKKGWPWPKGSEPLPESMLDGSPWPKISIVTPSYNQAPFLEETIRSVVLQGYPNLEYIIIDGGSTDGSVDIIKKYEPWLHYWESQKDQGQAQAINKGWKISSGAFLSWINSDDVLKPQSLFRVMEQFENHASAGLIYGDNERIDENGQILSVKKGKKIDLPDMLTSVSMPVPQPGSVIRRSIVEQVDYLNENWQVVLDRDLFLRCGLYCNFLYIPEALAQIRLHPNAKSSAEKWKWVNEKRLMYKHFFNEQRLPLEVRNLKYETIGRAYLKATKISILTNRRILSNLLNAVFWYPKISIEPDFKKIAKKIISRMNIII